MKYLVLFCLFATAAIIGCTNITQPDVASNASLNGTWKVSMPGQVKYENTYKTVANKLIVNADTFTAKFSSNQIITEAMSESCGFQTHYFTTYTIDSDSTFHASCSTVNPVTTYGFSGVKQR